MTEFFTLQNYLTWSRTKRRVGTEYEDRLNASLGLAGEFGEICDLYKKHKFHGHELDKEKLKLELGDLLFYLVWAWELNHGEFFELTPNEVEVSFFGCFAELTNALFIGVPYKDDFCSALGALEEFADMHLDLTLNDIIKANVDKLEARYPGGFSEEKSRERVT